jgi:hypothetical protein
MVIGLRYGGIRADDVEAREKTYAMVREFLQKFKNGYGLVACTDLLCHNLSDPQQHADSTPRKVATERCLIFIWGAVELVETLL